MARDLREASLAMCIAQMALSHYAVAPA